MIIFLISKNFGVFHNCLSCMEYISVVLFYHTRIINYNYFGVFSICSLICFFECWVFGWGWCLSFTVFLKWWFLVVCLSLYLWLCVYMSVDLASVYYNLLPGIVGGTEHVVWRRCPNRYLLCERSFCPSLSQQLCGALLCCFIPTVHCVSNCCCHC